MLLFFNQYFSTIVNYTNYTKADNFEFQENCEFLKEDFKNDMGIDFYSSKPQFIWRILRNFSEYRKQFVLTNLSYVIQRVKKEVS